MVGDGPYRVLDDLLRTVQIPDHYLKAETRYRLRSVRKNHEHIPVTHPLQLIITRLLCVAVAYIYSM